MERYDLISKINVIMPRLSKLLDKISVDQLVSISLDEVWYNGTLLTFARYNGIDYDVNNTYQMRAIIGVDKIIYENAVNGVEVREFIVDEYGMSLEEYDSIMSL